MEQVEEAINLLRRRWWLIPVTALVAVAIVLILDVLATPRYRTQARYLVSPVPQEDPGDLVDSTEALRNRTVPATFAEVFNSPTLQQQAAAAVPIEDPEAYEVAAVVLPETSILQVTVSGPDPAVAQQLANNLGNEVVTYLERFAGVYQLNELDPAPLVEEPYAPQPLRDTTIALVLGAAVGTILALGLPFLVSILSLTSVSTTVGADGGLTGRRLRDDPSARRGGVRYP